MRFPLTCLASLLLLPAVACPAAEIAPIPPPAVAPVVPLAAEPFDLAQVRLGPGPFHEAMERNRAVLLRLEPDRLLHTFRLNVGLPTTAEPYVGWEAPHVELRGHSLGHYLTACALMYRSTGDEALRARIDQVVAGLAQCQSAAPRAGFNPGYLSAFPESFIDRVETGQPVWAPWYTLHKLLAGLIDAHQLAGSGPAREVAERMASWIDLRVSRLRHEQMQRSLQTEFGGIGEALAQLYSVTGDARDLRLAQAFDHEAVIGPLAHGEDPLDGLHANTQIPKAIAAARAYELTGDPRYRAIAETFWDRVARHRSYVIGGHSDREHFFPVEEFARHLSPETTETCNTYNMLKLTRHLFAWQPDAARMDFYERGLYNHILASQDPALGSFVYLMSLEPGHFKTYSSLENSFWCCVGTGMENHAKYGDTIFAHDESGLFVNLFIPAEVRWPARRVNLRQETAFPREDTTRLVWQADQPQELALRVRHPGWSRGPLRITINGDPVAVESRPGSYAELHRTWRSGDVVEVRLQPELHAESLPGAPDVVALLYGPLVLAGRLGQDDMPAPYARDQLDQARHPPSPVPAFVTTADDWLGQIERISRDPLLFRTRGLAQPRDVLLAPFHTVHHERYTVYWNRLTPGAWEGKLAAAAGVEQQWAAVQASAVDCVTIADASSEAAHGFAGEKTEHGKRRDHGWRHARNGGFFQYTLQTHGRTPLTLVCAYGSRDAARSFDVWVDDRSIATPQPATDGPGEIVLERYELPAELTSGKESVTVSFRAHRQWNAATANVFGCALVSPAGALAEVAP